MTELLVKLFVKEYNETEKMSVRTSYGVMASIVGIFCNVLLFVVKCMAGLSLHSVSVMADAFNNLSDAGSSVISFVGVKMANKPADKKHPFGHGRMEYVAALLVSFLVMEVGLSFLRDSIGKLGEETPLRFDMGMVVLLGLSVGVKLWLAVFNRTLGKRIHSKVMMATATDAIGDVCITSVTILSILVYAKTGQNIDSVVGIGVALAIIWAGIGIARDILEPILGQAIPREVYDQITDFVERYEGVEGTHDLLVHNYGPGKSMASLHVEVPNDMDVETAHTIVDSIERDAKKQLELDLVIHVDPIELKNQEVLQLKEEVVRILRELDERASIHDFRVVFQKKRTNLIFDMVVPMEYGTDRQQQLCGEVQRRMREIHESYHCVIMVETSFIEEEA